VAWFSPTSLVPIVYHSSNLWQRWNPRRSTLRYPTNIRLSRAAKTIRLLAHLSLSIGSKGLDDSAADLHGCGPRSLASFPVLSGATSRADTLTLVPC